MLQHISECITARSVLISVTGFLMLPRVPEECPQAIVDLYLACISLQPGKRPNAAEVMQAIESAMLTIPGTA